ncbi:MAG: hypothetical protein QXJ51_02970 [Sulfolobales archaeon]
MTSGRELLKKDVCVIADWDADGAVSSAVILYAQKYEGVYPLKKRTEIDFYPSEPFGGFKVLERIPCYEAVILLDLPFIISGRTFIENYKRRCSDSRIIFIDHHLSSHKSLEMLPRYFDESLIGYSPTSKISYDKILSEGARVNERLDRFVKTVFYMDQGLKVPEDLRGVMKLLAGISKYMAFRRDENTWIKVVEWMAPRIVMSSLDSEILTRILKVAEELDRNMRSQAMEIAVSTQRLGLFRYIDARRKWKRKGASSLASNLYRIFRAPVALLVRDPHDDKVLLLVVKYPGKAYRVAEEFEKRKLIESIGGHPSLAIVRFKKDYLDQILDLLKRIRV